ncbi:hypothetical protein [Aequorivita antarctica]|uniref:hypothetical protein n=1 Tax=Aequorivita antarctica TaxID=153266 RepID=UPI0013577E0C|nr:hypothetical protein [Aequorivita antarctica]
MKKVQSALQPALGTLPCHKAQLFCRPRRPVTARLYHQRPRSYPTTTGGHCCAGGGE